MVDIHPRYLGESRDRRGNRGDVFAQAVLFLPSYHLSADQSCCCLQKRGRRHLPNHIIRIITYVISLNSRREYCPPLYYEIRLRGFDTTQPDQTESIANAVLQFQPTIGYHTICQFHASQREYRSEGSSPTDCFRGISPLTTVVQLLKSHDWDVERAVNA